MSVVVVVVADCKVSVIGEEHVIFPHGVSGPRELRQCPAPAL